MQFTVRPYNVDNLSWALSNKITDLDEVKKKYHFTYFSQYLGPTDGGLNAKTIIVEHEYVSRSYLIDYSNYYSTCFNPYEKVCKRVHFFNEPINEEEFYRLSISQDPKLQKSYLGFVVVKPLPKAKIGATILKTYSDESTGRYFRAVKKYEINLLGNSLYLNSLAFIEQDRVVGACASSALWSSFQKTSSLFQTLLPSPSDITKSAKSLFHNSGRIFPNEGLDYFQIGNAIESVGLVSELRNSKRIRGVNWFKSFVYAYNRIGLPVLLGINIENMGLHLISIVGYREEKPKAYKRKKEITLKAEQIERFYAHDDQIGPFSRLGISKDVDNPIETSWVDEKTGDKRNAAIHSVIVPLSNKIRINFEEVYKRAMFLEILLSQIITSHEIVWDIYIDFSNKYKSETLSSSVSDHYKRKVVSESYPRYVWIAKAHADDECISEFIFDATDIATANYCQVVNIFNDSVRLKISDILSDGTSKTQLEQLLTSHVVELLEKDVQSHSNSN